MTAPDSLEGSDARIAVLSRIHLAFIRGVEAGELFDNLLRELLELTDGEYGFIGEIHRTDEGQPFLQTHAITNIAWNTETRRFFAENGPQGMRFYNLDTLFGAVMTGERPVIANTPGEDPRRGGLPAGHPDLNAFLGLPLFKGDELVGMVGMANRPGGYDQGLVDYLEPVLVTCASLVVAFRSERSRREAEHELRRHAEELKETNEVLRRRNAELNEFAYLANHDLKEPLRTLVSYSGLLQRDLGEDLSPSVEEDLRFIVNAATRMQDLVRDLLELSNTRRLELRLQEVSLDECIDEVLDRLADTIADSMASIEREELPRVWGDPTLLKQVYENLISNAIKYAGEERPVIRLTAGLEDGAVCLGVEDNGIGIDPRYAEDVFAPFKRLHGRDEYSGTGVGLAICRKALERLGGKIWVEPGAPSGSRFRFVLEPTDSPD